MRFVRISFFPLNCKLHAEHPRSHDKTVEAREMMTGLVGSRVAYLSITPAALGDAHFITANDYRSRQQGPSGSLPRARFAEAAAPSPLGLVPLRPLRVDCPTRSGLDLHPSAGAATPVGRTAMLSPLIPAVPRAGTDAVRSRRRGSGTGSARVAQRLLQ